MERLKGEGVQDWLSQHLTAPWHGHQTVASELGNDIIANIKERWSQLESSVRLGVLFSLISLKKAQQIQLKDKCQELIDHACSDPDDWVRLVSQMLKEFPRDATLRFNVEQFADQAQLGSLLDELTSHISRDGIKFHPKEFAYLSDSVCKAGQGKDPATKAYPPLTGPSLQQHFNLRDSHVSIHTERAERLKKMAEQASPIVSSGSFPSAGTGAAGSAIGTATPMGAPTSATGPAAAVSSSVGATPQASTPLGPPGHPRPPAKSSSTGLFVRKPAGSFLRNNAPRPMPLSRNPSTGQLPLRSPRLDSPTTPRLNQKSSRIQILDIQQGNEIMQSMNDEKRRKEQAEQREKELKREQRQQELEAKRQQDAEKKAQLQREKDEKKREKEEAKKNKEKQKQERDRQRQERDQDNDQAQTGEIREARDDDDDDDGEDEGSLSTLPAKKRARINSSNSRRGSREDDNDYDNERSDRSREPLSPSTSSHNHAYSSQISMDDGRPTPAGASLSGGNNYSDSYFSQQQQLQQQQQQGSSVVSDNPTIFQDTNLLTAEDRAYIEAFLEGHPMKRPHENESLYQIVMNQKQVQDASGKIMYETILIEMNFDTGEWKKIKRRRAKPHVPTTATTSTIAMPQ
ncbi:hypothetical protein BGX21_007717 [Mortierella sp. AD011]|nr:hypothetical protein BGX20_010158 [Mortierella sp. AD010]KAF9398484.1 hypothetical protein BGX21_007717 [Mortierella sp. AD011]